MQTSVSSANEAVAGNENKLSSLQDSYSRVTSSLEATLSTMEQRYMELMAGQQSRRDEISDLRSNMESRHRKTTKQIRNLTVRTICFSPYITIHIFSYYILP